MDNALSNTAISAKALRKLMQCELMFYNAIHHPDKKQNNNEKQQILLASRQDLFPFLLSHFSGDSSLVLNETEDSEDRYQRTLAAIANGDKLIPKPLLKNAGFKVALDLLVKNDAGNYTLVELKATMSVNKQQIQDACFNWMVAKNALPGLEHYMVACLNGGYYRRKNLDTAKLFKFIDITKKVNQLTEESKDIFDQANKLIVANTPPIIPTGIQCFKPQECEFLQVCWKEKDTSIFKLSGINKERLIDMRSRGIETVEQITSAEELPEKVMIQAHAIATNETVVDKKQLKKYLKGFKLPCAFIDFENVMPSIPMFEGQRLFDSMPFLYSIHWVNNWNEPPVHFTHISAPEELQSPLFIQKFIETVKDAGSIVAFNAKSEVLMLNQLIAKLPELKPTVDGIAEKMVDIAKPFDQNWYYNPEMQGRYSLKYIVKALSGIDLYEHLAIKNGLQASKAYEQLCYGLHNGSREELLKNLTDYCAADSYAALLIQQKLFEITR